tara:strand:+ start:176 stop:379 length:204 start_codon:yes stop_codon:yes gene_type:complete
MFQEGMIIRAFTNITENSIEIFHLFKNKEYVAKTRATWTNQFWQDIKEMGGQFHLLWVNVKLSIHQN